MSKGSKKLVETGDGEAVGVDVVDNDTAAARRLVTWSQLPTGASEAPSSHVKSDPDLRRSNLATVPGSGVRRRKVLSLFWPIVAIVGLALAVTAALVVFVR